MGLTLDAGRERGRVSLCCCHLTHCTREEGFHRDPLTGVASQAKDSSALSSWNHEWNILVMRRGKVRHTQILSRSTAARKHTGEAMTLSVSRCTVIKNHTHWKYRKIQPKCFRSQISTCFKIFCHSSLHFKSSIPLRFLSLPNRIYKKTHVSKSTDPLCSSKKKADHIPATNQQKTHVSKHPADNYFTTTSLTCCLVSPAHQII